MYNQHPEFSPNGACIENLNIWRLVAHYYSASYDWGHLLYCHHSVGPPGVVKEFVRALCLYF